MAGHLDDIAIGSDARGKLKIVGRPRQGCREKMIMLEEPDPRGPVPMHFNKTTKLKLPHFRKHCPNCNGNDDPTLYWYVGCWCQERNEFAIAELTEKCFESLAAAARTVGPASETGKIVGLHALISRADYQGSPRVLRCEQRVHIGQEWPYVTREALARVWGVPIGPRLFKAEGA
jgi:hypothetical protein